MDYKAFRQSADGIALDGYFLDPRQFGEEAPARPGWMGGSVGRATAPGHPPQVLAHLEGLAKEVAIQRDTIGRLTERLTRVMAPIPDAERGKAGELRGRGENEVMCQMAAHVLDLSRAVAANTAMIEALTARLEV